MRRRGRDLREKAGAIDKALQDVKEFGELAQKGEKLGLEVLALCRDLKQPGSFDLAYRVEILEPLAKQVVPKSIRRKAGLE